MACKSGQLQQILLGLSSRNNSYFSSPTKASHLRTALSVLESFSWEERVTFLFILQDIPQSICIIFDSYFDKQVFVFWMNVLLLRPLGITELSSSMIISKNVDFELSSLTLNRPGGKLPTGWFFPELC